MGDTRSVAVVGAGVVGLSIAWHLLRLGVDVTVVEQSSVASGASYGNAGWISPGLATPLPEPSVLRFGLRSLLDRNSPLYVPPTSNGAMIAFALKFAKNCTTTRWIEAMKALLPLNEAAITSYDFIVQHCKKGSLHTTSAPILAAFYTKADAVSLKEEIKDIKAAGGTIETEELEGKELRELYPFLSANVKYAQLLLGQRYIDPYAFTRALAEEVKAEGGKVVLGQRVLGVEPSSNQVTTRLSNGDRVVSDSAVIATGAWAGPLAKKLGVKVSQAAGRGYSFWSESKATIAHPVYFPRQRIACTPIDGGLRVAGTMEIADLQRAYDPKRVDAIVANASGLLSGVDLRNRRSEWVGPRPITHDGLPVIGPTNSRRIWVAAGHGMWGVTYAPITGELVAKGITENRTPTPLLPFSPLR
ncbi:D-amino-acid dehydrogenase [Ferrithrix thermotolerans DSM 19514]|uniref:D-amino-acid dehydrogenase n=1 Tax=Ferrithrix thermotolerans DSM 19514 TaxID=1121881 RepID=A0A1M4U5C9_9ACTN|nr:FAD-dependent oxidoreductase [Ferrithrix thermotolerans]SHE52041.1 D-amino-acid dehydrogenase [Ferrithrix thermotolerans DSM 19514]